MPPFFLPSQQSSLQTTALNLNLPPDSRIDIHYCEALVSSPHVSLSTWSATADTHAKIGLLLSSTKGVPLLQL